MAIPALVTVNGVDLPEPSSYEATTSTIVDSGRNVQGKVVGSVVRHDVAKVSLKWNYLTAQQWAAILSLFTTRFTVLFAFITRQKPDTIRGRCTFQTEHLVCGGAGLNR